MSQLLPHFLGSAQRPEGTLTFHELQGFLFAVACAPELIRPSEWLPQVFNEQEVEYASMDEARSVMQALMELYNEITTQVHDGAVALPRQIVPLAPALVNADESAVLGQWSRGFLLGHNWLDELWNHYTPKDLKEELTGGLMVMTFFSSRKLAEAYYREFAQSSRQTLTEFAEGLLGIFDSAMASYAHLGRSIQIALAEQGQARQPCVNEKKVGRNEPCPCGSGKKYKNCCLH